MRIENISKSFSGLQVLSKLTFDFPAGEVTAISGPSGCGKTTLGNILLGLIKPDTGFVRMAEGLRLAAVFQEDRLIETMSAAENIHLVSGNVAKGDLENAMCALGLDPKDTRRVSKFSGGMKRRVAILRAALYAPDMLILDEPFKGLDLDARARAARFLLQRCDRATIALITHDPSEKELMGAKHFLDLPLLG